MKTSDLLAIWAQHPKLAQIDSSNDISLSNNLGSSTAMLIAGYFQFLEQSHLVILNNRDEALYYYTDLANVLGEQKVLFLPSSFNKGISQPKEDGHWVKQRTETLSQLKQGKKLLVVTDHQAIYEKVANLKTVKN